MILTKDQIRKAITEYFAGKPVKKVWLFGSYARGEADDDSDVDMLVDFEKNSKVGLRYLAWHEEIEELMHKKVQVVSQGSVSESLRPFIDADKTLMYER